MASKSTKKKHCVVNIDSELHSIVSDFCQNEGVPISRWVENLLMDEMKRVMQKKGKRVKPLELSQLI